MWYVESEGLGVRWRQPLLGGGWVWYVESEGLGVRWRQPLLGGG